MSSLLGSCFTLLGMHSFRTPRSLTSARATCRHLAHGNQAHRPLQRDRSLCEIPMIDDVVTSEFWCISGLELLTAMPVECTPPLALVFGSPQGKVGCTSRLVQALGSLSELSELLQFLAQGQQLSCQGSLRSGPGAYLLVKATTLTFIVNGAIVFNFWSSARRSLRTCAT